VDKVIAYKRAPAAVRENQRKYLRYTIPLSLRQYFPSEPTTSHDIKPRSPPHPAMEESTASEFRGAGVQQPSSTDMRSYTKICSAANIRASAEIRTVQKCISNFFEQTMKKELESPLLSYSALRDTPTLRSWEHQLHWKLVGEATLSDRVLRAWSEKDSVTSRTKDSVTERQHWLAPQLIKIRYARAVEAEARGKLDAHHRPCPAIMTEEC